MNKFIALIVLLLFISCSSKSQSKEETTIGLKEAFEKNDEKLFLKNFPKNHSQFVSYFGWNDSLDIPCPLYDESTEYIDKFFDIISKDKDKLNLIIDIGINGKYQADGVNYFKSNIEKLFIKNPDLSCELLKNRSSQEIDSFWYFYLDSPQPLTSVPDNFKPLKVNCKEVYSSLEKELLLIQKQNLVSEITTENETNKLKSLNDFIPKGYNILDSVSGYLNEDVFLDRIIVLANNEEYKNNEARMFMILLNDIKEEYTLKIKTQNVIPCLKCAGGTGGEDSYNDLVFKRNILSFTQLKTSDSKLIEIKYEFLNKNSDFMLNKISVTKSNLTDDLKFRVEVEVKNKTSIKDFNYHNYVNYLKYYVKINDSDGYTNLRKEKNSSSEVLQKIKTGSKIEVLDNSGDWWLVQTSENKKGYVYKSKIVSE